MTGTSIPDPMPDIDRWIASKLAELHDALNRVLDIDAGLMDARLPKLRRLLDEALDDVLDIDAGLRAILPRIPTPASPPDQPVPSDSKSELRKLAQQITSTPLRERLVFRAYLPLQELSIARSIAMWCVAASSIVDVLVVARDLASDLARARARARTLARARERARARARDLARALARDLGLGLGLASALASALTRDLTRAGNLDHALARDLACAGDLAGDLALALDPALDLAHDLARARDRASDLSRARDLAGDLALDLDRALDRALADARPDARDLDLDRALARTLDLALDNYQMFVDVVDMLITATTDFTGADLMDIDLQGLHLSGIRWSSTTQWPATWEEPIRQASVEISEGLYEIRDDRRMWVQV